MYQRLSIRLVIMQIYDNPWSARSTLQPIVQYAQSILQVAREFSSVTTIYLVYDMPILLLLFLFYRIEN